MSYAFDFGPSTAPAPQYGRRSSFAPTTQPVYAKPDLSALLNSRPVDTNSAFFDDPANKKRTRTLTTPRQLERLNALYNETPFPSTQRREEVAAELDMSSRRVQVWFQNKRQGQKREIAKSNAVLPSRYSPSESSSNSSSRTKTPSPPYLGLETSTPTSFSSSKSLYRGGSASSYTSDSYPAPLYTSGHSYRDPTPPEPLSPATPLYGNNPYSSNYFSSSASPSGLPAPRSRRNSLTSSYGSSLNGPYMSSELFPRTGSPMASTPRSTGDRLAPMASFNLPPVSSLIPEVDRLSFARSTSSTSGGGSRPNPKWF